MDWKRIPSLPALRALEAAARLGSLAAAAEALNVTPAAVSQHIRTLEAEFGPLMRREGRRLIPTDHGRLLAAGLSDGFGRIAAAVDSLRGELEGAPVSVSLTPGFATNWLMPRLGTFWAEHPDIDLSLRPTEALVDVSGEGFDIAIRYGRGRWPGVRITWLTGADFLTVAAPSYIARMRAQGIAPQEGRWFFEPMGTEYRTWAEQHSRRPAQARVTTLDTNDLVLAALRAGHGISVQPRALVEADIANRILEVLDEGSDPDMGYYIVTASAPLRPPARAFVDWLLSAA